MTVQGLIGREAERRQLKSALDDPAIRVIRVQGFSGAGKTALVQAGLVAAQESGAIVGQGKYAAGSGSGAFGPVLLALSEAVNGALELLYDSVSGAEALRKSMEPQLALLASAGLNVAGITPALADPSIALGPGNVARIIEAALGLLRWLDGFAVPVVLFIDDWQRAPREVRGFVPAVAREEVRCTLILGERYETGAARADVEQEGTEEIVLNPLNARDRESLLEAAVGKAGAGAAIALWLGDSSSGLPFDLLQAADALKDSKALVERNGTWTVDTALAGGINRADFSNVIMRRLQQMPEKSLRTGAAIALWGDRSPIALVCEALGEAPRATQTDLAVLEQGGIIAIDDQNVRVLHDRLRSALLDAVTPSARRLIASQMSERMVRWTPEQWSRVARTALYMRLAGGLDEADPGLWRDRFARGALASRTAADNAAAADFAEAAWSLRKRAKPSEDEVDRLILREGTFAAGMRHDRDALVERAQTLIAHAADDKQRGEAYEAAILAARQMGEAEIAWRWVVEGLKGFDIALPNNATLRDVAWWTVRWLMAQLRRAELDPARISASRDPLMRIANIGGVIAFEANRIQATLIALKASVHAKRRSYTDPIWIATDVFISASLGRYAQAARLGEHAAQYADRSPFSPATTLYRALYFGLIWGRPLKTLVASCETVYQWSMAEGDVGNAAVAVRNDGLLAWHCALTLEAMLERIAEDVRRAERLADERALFACQEFVRFATMLRDPNGFNEPLDYASRIAPSRDGWGTPIAWVQMLALRGDWPGVVEFCAQLTNLRPQMNTHPAGVIWRFLESMARRRLGKPIRKEDVRFVRRAAALNPVDHRAKLLLLEADAHRDKGQREKAVEAYALAVEFAARGSSRIEEGMVAEFAAFGVRVLGDAVAAARYEEIARQVWRRFGARAKLGAATPESRVADVRVAEAESLAAAAARSERAKSRFLAEVAHELRTPLQGMQGLIELAAERREEVDLKELRDVLGSLRNVVDDLTEMEALGAGAPLNVQPTDVAGLLEAEATAFGAVARNKGLAFSVSLAASAAGHFLVDASRLRQIVRNLLSNAVKYVDAGSVTLRAEAAAERSGALEYTIAVEDTGPGIREADLPRLFEPFERGGREGGNGLGLGLALSRRIAERMQGHLVAENLKPHGARFVLSLPVERGEPAEAVAAVAVKPLRLLLVEDVPLSRRMVAALLRRDGHEVREAASGLEALDICLSEAVDLAFLDLGLPDIDGLEVLRRLREAGCKTPVVVLTASAVPAMKTRAHEAGAVMTLRKPASGTELRNAIAEAVSHDNPTSVQGQQDDFASLAREARVEISAMAEEIVEHASSMDAAAIRMKAHRLAGLAAQFMASDMAEAADLLEATATAGENLGPALTGVAIALVRYRAEP